MKTSNKSAADHHAAKRRWLNSHEEGYHKAMGNRQVQMIAIGGAIGTGLFLGAGARLQMAGPALALVYLVCGIFSFFILRALGELVLHRPSSGSFVSYAREFLGEKAAYVAGWMYFVNWAMTGIVDITAVALYMHYWGAFGDVPQWVFALGALAIVGTMNMIGVKWFAEMEFWFALVKVLAIVVFLVVGTVFLGSGKPLDGNATGFHLITDNGGFFPHGLLPALVLVQGVVFAFASIELVGTAAGECKDPQTMVPKAINSVIWRIGLFYVGSVVLLVLFGGGSFFELFALRGLVSDNWAELSWPARILDYLWHMVLPITASVVGSLAVTTLLTKNTFLEQIRAQYVLTARAKGVGETRILYRHVFRNAMIPLVTGFPAAFIGAFFAGSLLIETLFSLDGLGLLAFDAVVKRDYPVVMGTLYLFTLIGLLARLASDLCYVWVDPRLRFDAVGH